MVKQEISKYIVAFASRFFRYCEWINCLSRAVPFIGRRSTVEHRCKKRAKTAEGKNQPKKGTPLNLGFAGPRKCTASVSVWRWWLLSLCLLLTFCKACAVCEKWNGVFFIAYNFKLMRLITTNWKISHTVKVYNIKMERFFLSFSSSVSLKFRIHLQYYLLFFFGMYDLDPPLVELSQLIASNWTLFQWVLCVFCRHSIKTLSGLCIILQLYRAQNSWREYWSKSTCLVRVYVSNVYMHI